jgi:hypothetical protein
LNKSAGKDKDCRAVYAAFLAKGIDFLIDSTPECRAILGCPEFPESGPQTHYSHQQIATWLMDNPIHKGKSKKNITNIHLVCILRYFFLKGSKGMTPYDIEHLMRAKSQPSSTSGIALEFVRSDSDQARAYRRRYSETKKAAVRMQEEKEANTTTTSASMDEQIPANVYTSTSSSNLSSVNASSIATQVQPPPVEDNPLPFDSQLSTGLPLPKGPTQEDTSTSQGVPLQASPASRPVAKSPSPIKRGRHCPLQTSPNRPLQITINNTIHLHGGDHGTLLHSMMTGDFLSELAPQYSSRSNTHRLHNRGDLTNPQARSGQASRNPFWSRRHYGSDSQL